MEENSERVLTTEKVNQDYKTRAPKFDEKVDAGDTEDLVAWYQKRKPITVLISDFFNCTMLVLCDCKVLVLGNLYYAELYFHCTMAFCKPPFVLCLLYYEKTKPYMIEFCTMQKFRILSY